MSRRQIIDKATSEIAKEKNISEWEVGTYDVVKKLADMLVNEHEQNNRLYQIERFPVGQPVIWEEKKFWVSEDIGLEKVLICNCEDTKNIQQPEYNDWWVGRDSLNVI